MIPPQFSVIVTCHNQAVFIQQAVKSAMAQSAGECEVIVVDDASTDNSVEILETFGNALRLIRMPQNIGANAARNIGTSLATGNYLVFLDGDDVLAPWALNTYKTLVAATKAPIILSRLLFFEGALPAGLEEIPGEVTFVEYGRLIEKDRTHRASASATVVEKTTFHRAGGWSEELFHLDDLDIMMKLGISGPCIQILSPPTTCYRMHQDNTVRQVAPFIPAMLTLIRKEKSGQYPGGLRFRFQRYAFLGGPIFFWIKKCLRAGLYGSAGSLFLHGWMMALAAVTRRLLGNMRSRVKQRSLQMLQS